MADVNPSLDPITNRSEIVFLYDAVDTNPNGDPLTKENRPRIDTDTNQAIVTATRLKRVVRDYLDAQGYPIFIKKAGAEENIRHDKNDRYEAIEAKMRSYLGDDLEAVDAAARETAFLAVATDTRLFGDTMAFDAAQDRDFLAHAYTGPVQFGFARSMHPVRVTQHGRTGVLARDSTEQRAGGTSGVGGNMFSEHRVAYALLRAHGVINEHAATDTWFGEDDVDLVMDGLWHGMRDMTNTATKKGHEPRLLLRVEYTADASHIGDLHRELELDATLDDPRAIRDIEEVVIDASAFVDRLDANAGEITAVDGRVSRRVQVAVDGDVGGPAVLTNAIATAVGADATAVSTD